MLSGSFGSILGLSWMLAIGWRPEDLQNVAAVVWWAGAAMIAIGLFGLAWTGCPMIRDTAQTVDRSKSVSAALGVLFYLVGTIAAAMAIIS